MPAYFCDRCGAPTSGGALCDACQQATTTEGRRARVNQRTKDRICWAALCAGLALIVTAGLFSINDHAVGFAVSLGGAMVSLLIGLITDR